MAKIIIATPTYNAVNLTKFLEYWKQHCSTKILSGNDINQAFYILYGYKERNNCISCLQNRGSQLRNIYNANNNKQLELQFDEIPGSQITSKTEVEKEPGDSNIAQANVTESKITHSDIKKSEVKNVVKKYNSKK